MPRYAGPTVGMLLLLAGAARPQAPEPFPPADQLPSVYLDESIDARSRLNTAEAFLKEGQWGEAVELLQALLETAGERIVRVGSERPNLFVSLRDYAQRRIAQLPPEGLRIYRERVDGQAADLLRRAEQTGDSDLYRRIANEMLCSSSGDEALERLGDLAFSAGRFSEAIASWSRLLPAELVATTRKGQDLRLAYPDPQIDEARVAAKWGIAQSFADNEPAAARAIAFLTKHHSTASGRLAGRTAPYWQTLAEVSKSSEAQSRPVDADWPTFAGDFRRSRVALGPIEIGDVQWTWNVRDKQARAAARPGGIEPIMPRAEDELNYHPIVMGEQVVLATERNLWSFDLKTGKADRWFEFTDVDARNGATLERPQQTVSAANGRLYVRVGGGVPRIPVNQFRTLRFRPSSKLYCFELATQRELWSVNSGEIGDGNAVFEGAPVMTDGLAVIAMTRGDAMSQTAVVGLDAGTGALRWRTVVCEAPNEDALDEPPGDTLLSLVDDTVYFGTNMGAVAALNVRTGGLRWVAVYPRRDRSLARFRRAAPGLNPCVVEGNRLFLAAADAERIQCYDAQTGVKLWDSPIPIVHLLGVAKGHLLATGNRVWAIDVETGKVRWYWPENTTTGYGRGVLAGDNVYWPTFSEIHVLDQATGRKVQSSIPLFDRLGIKAGNMVVGSGVLILAQADRLLAIYPYSRLIKKLEAELVSNPAAAALHYQLAQAAFGHGDLALAERHFDLAATHARADEMIDGTKLSELARRRLSQTRRERALELVKAGQLEPAEASYRSAMAAAETPPERAALARELALAWQKANRPDRAVAVLQMLLDVPDLRPAVVAGSDNVRIPAALWAGRAQRELLAQHGRSIYAEIERQAEAARRQARTPDELAAVAERFPLLADRGALLLKAGRGFEDAGRRRDALRAYKLLTETGLAEPPERLEALCGVHRLYKAAGQWEADRVLLDRLAHEFATHVAPRSEGVPVGQWVAAERAEIDRLAQSPRLAGPVFRKSAEPALAEGRYVFPQGRAPASLPSMIFVAEPNRLLCRAAAAPFGQRPVWSAELGAEPVWLGYCAAGLLAATSERLVCIEYTSGSILWERPADESGAVRWAGAPSVRAEFRAEDQRDSTPEPDRCPHCAVAGEIIVTSTGHGRLRGIDVEQGALRWETDVGKGNGPWRLQLVGALVCLISSDRLVGIEPLTGRQRFSLELRGSTGEVMAVRPDRLVAIAARDELVAVDPGVGSIAWRAKLLWPARHAPRLFAEAGRLVALVDGFQLTGLDLGTGKELWSKALCPAPADHLAADLAGETFVYALNGTLAGRDAGSGELRWRRPLPQGGNPLVRALAAQTEVFATSAARAHLLVLHTADGQPMQALVFPDAGPEVQWHAAHGFSLVTGSRTTWVLDRASSGKTNGDRP